ncbi:MAG TPA: aminotransferase class I/II-fold pyridoxal phosphate-dependent enzyme [Phycisphaerae bacterium]|nr:aminotransferase class I/II-fold pyridoxal phosphate-dependent enzyme [Phycisphaerales bacterium]HRX84520.1 aminotransferase class I/II-fold pyridoxal phosphate-dependent enzyme [Phycisphaerae bacterium]
MDTRRFVADRIAALSGSGIRRIFDLAATLKDPIDFSMGQPDFPVPEPIKAAAARAIAENRNGYTVTYGLPALRDRIRKQLQQEFGWDPQDSERSTFVTCGVSGGLMLAMLACLNAGDEVIIPDPYFVSYPHLVMLAGGKAVPVDTAPSYTYDPQRLAAAITPRTKALVLASPSNPTGVVYSADQVQAVCAVAQERDLLIISDEIYQMLCFDAAPTSPATYAPERTIVLRGFGKSYGATGWRMGYAAGPAAVVNEMAKIQQYTFVCAPHPLQQACLAAFDVDMSAVVAAYRKKRDLGVGILRERFELASPGGGFFYYCRAPQKFATGTAFVEAAIQRNVLTVPGAAFSTHDTHFRISYAVPDEKLRAGCEILCELAG